MDEIEWNVINEGQLLDAMVGHKPVGINRNFQMACICDKFADNIQRDISSAKVWQHLETMYNLDVLNESERMPFPNAESDFALDELEFGEIMLLKKDEDKKQVQQQQRPNTPKGRETPKLIKEISKNSEKAQIITATPTSSVANTPKSSGVGGNSTPKDQQQTPQARRDSKDNINSNTNNNTTKDKDTTTSSTSTITSSSATVGNKTPNIPKKEIGNTTTNSNNNKKEPEKTMATNKSAKITKNNTASTTTINATVASGNNSATVGNTASAPSKEDSAGSGAQSAIKSGVAKASGRTNSEDGSSSTTPKLPAIKRPLRGSFKPDDLATGGSANVSTNNGGKSSSPVTVATSGGGQSSAKRRRI